MQQLYSVKAYHSTRQKGLKKFESRTTTATIDTGEGAHVHGWGLYLQADEMENRRLYLDAFTGNASNAQGEDYHVKAWGKEFDVYCSEDVCGINDAESFTPYDFENAGLTAAEELYITLIINGYTDEEIGYILNEVLEEAESVSDDEYDEDYPEILLYWDEDTIREVINLSKKGVSDFEETIIVPEDPEPLPDGTHYEQASQYTVEIPDDMVFIDEVQTPPKWIVDKFSGYCEQHCEKKTDLVKNIGNDNSGWSFYKRVGYVMQDLKGFDLDWQQLASLWLSENGIDGMTYEGGRDGGCFVIYNCDKLKIVAEY